MKAPSAWEPALPRLEWGSGSVEESGAASSSRHGAPGQGLTFAPEDALHFKWWGTGNDLVAFSLMEPLRLASSPSCSIRPITQLTSRSRRPILSALIVPTSIIRSAMRKAN